LDVISEEGTSFGFFISMTAQAQAFLTLFYMTANLNEDFGCGVLPTVISRKTGLHI
jgi:hypothetical protein